MIPSWNCVSKNASYSAIAELLQQHGVKTSRARVAEYGRIVLEGGKSRKRRKRAKTAPAANIPATPQSAPAVAAKPTPAMPDCRKRLFSFSKRSKPNLCKARYLPNILSAISLKSSSGYVRLAPSVELQWGISREAFHPNNEKSISIDSVILSVMPTKKNCEDRFCFACSKCSSIEILGSWKLSPDN